MQDVNETPNSAIGQVQLLQHHSSKHDDQEDGGKSKLFPPPPGYFTEFKTPKSMEPPDLSLVSTKNYSLYFQMNAKIDLKPL